MKYHVKTHKWDEGHLSTRVYLFHTVEEALAFLELKEFFSAKIFNEIGELIHSLGHHHVHNGGPYC